MGQKRHAFILGATGAVGQQLLRRLVERDRFVKVHAPTRRELPIQNKKIVSYPFEALFRPWELEFSVTDFFYCFGSTMASAGGVDEFRRMELSVAHEALMVAKQTGVKRFYLVSVQGVSPQSMVPYLKVKAEVEKVLKNHAFQALYVYRPSLLIAAREELRLTELVLQRVSRPMLPILQRYIPGRAPVRAEQVAQAMLVDALQGEEGHFVRENRQIIELASL
jgi:uncharacterized protein YbjT (DUF2867 family)